MHQKTRHTPVKHINTHSENVCKIEADRLKKGLSVLRYAASSLQQAFEQVTRFGLRRARGIGIGYAEVLVYCHKARNIIYSPARVQTAISAVNLQALLVVSL